MALSVLRFNFASPQGNPSTQRELINAALELAEWGDIRGVTAVSVDEHHVTGHGIGAGTWTQPFTKPSSRSTPWSRQSGSPALSAALTSISPLAPQKEHSLRQRTITVLGSRGAPNISRCEGGCRPSSSVMP